MLLTTAISTSRMAVRLPAVRLMSVYKGGIATKDELATGMERVQLDAFKAGVADPFDREVHVLSSYEEGTGRSKAKPIKVANLGVNDRRQVMCKCERSEHNFSFMNLYLGDAPKRCDCGLWFELIKTPAPHEIWTPEEAVFDAKAELPIH